MTKEEIEHIEEESSPGRLVELLAGRTLKEFADEYSHVEDLYIRLCDDLKIHPMDEEDPEGYEIYINFSVRCGMGTDPKTDAQWILGKICAKEEGSDEGGVEIGEITLMHLNFENAIDNNPESNFHYLADVSQEVEYYCSELYDSSDLGDGYWNESVSRLFGDSAAFSPNLLILERILIHQKYRGMGFGALAIVRSISQFSGGCGYVCLKVLPTQIEFKKKGKLEAIKLHGLEQYPTDLEVASEQLAVFYRKLGFHRLPGTSLMLFPLAHKPVSLSSLGANTMGFYRTITNLEHANSKGISQSISDVI